MARGISGRKLHFQGEVSCNILLVGKTLKSKVYVLQNVSNLFGTDWIVLFNLWELPINPFCNKINVSSPFKNRVTENMIKDLKIKFPQVFSEGLGICKKTEAKFEVKESAKPIFKRKRNVPFGALEQIDKELERLENLGIISGIEFSEWACPVVYVKKKNNKIRTCADFLTGQNDCLRDHTYYLPSPEDVFASFNGGKIFSKLDLSDAYLQVKVEEECSKLLTINTHKGLHKFNRLSFGLKVSPRIFQRIMVTMLAGLDLATAYLDDILIKSKDRKTHFEHSIQVFERIEEY